MSPEPHPLKICETNEIVAAETTMSSTEFLNKTIANSKENDQVTVAMNITNTRLMAEEQNGILIKPSSLTLGRERRNVSPSLVNLQESFADPQSPSSSSSTSQATSANDATFEPTIEMMVNDFDDEQTLNEEEALAALETQDPDEEINTLREESEMPLEELLAKYRALPPPLPSFSEQPRKKFKKSMSSHKKKHKSKQKQDVAQTSNEKIEDMLESKNQNEVTKHAKASIEFIVTESGDEKDVPEDDKADDEGDEEVISGTLSPKLPIPLVYEDRKETNDNTGAGVNFLGEILKVRRSHLLDLYPEGTFDNVVVKDAVTGNAKDIPLETLYDVEDDEDEEIEEEEDEDYKKKVMIGTSYQAIIPVGLSQYGDILPYENEDKLIWEPSQVSEREVEEYLIKIRDIKSNQGDEDTIIESHLESNTKENGKAECSTENLENNSLLANGDKLHIQTVTMTDIDSQSVVKDNEQALHLLVQCGYDFKEALRRKRLNALPLTDCMSLWSEEECHKFEEGIQKYGKDFLKIRQNQVRTRTMRELVQFYYLWKKSERRDHNFANADTVDHMDIYLNEDNEYGSNPASLLTPVGSPVGTTSTCTGPRRTSAACQKNISIMTTTTINSNTSTTHSNTLPANLEKNFSNTSVQQQQQKRRTSSCNNSNHNNVMTNDFNNENSTTMLTHSTK